MQKIIDAIQSGELSQKQLIEGLVQYNDKTNAEHDEACDVVENNQAVIQKLEAEKRQLIAENAKIKVEALATAKHATSVGSEMLRLKSDNKILKPLQKENSSLKKLKAKHIEGAKQLRIKNDSLIRDCKDYRAQIAKNQSDIARLRITGFKDVDNYSFTLFPSKIKVEENGEINQRINLVLMDNVGNMKIVGVNSDGEVAIPECNDFELNEAQTDFITSFDRIAKADKNQFTDRVLAMVN